MRQSCSSLESGKGTEMVDRITYLITFSCNHTRVFQEPAPSIAEWLWCPRCRKNVQVKSAPAEWRIRCQDCQYTRRFGTGNSAADVAAAKHRNLKGGHVVSIFNGHELAYVIGERDLLVTSMLPE